ncbi:MAG: Cys-tRNA(Pro) deacylase [Arenicella sp.]|nr:Cys-tRNA(Pro) deacylase [Arenicella sp.]
MTPAIDLATKYNVVFTVHQYQHSPNIESYGDEAAATLGIDPKQVFKTLVVELNTGELAVGVVPVSGSLNLKAIASAASAKKAAMADKLKVQRSSGYVLGGVSPIGQRKQLTTIIDNSANNFSTIFVSAGKRGLEIELRASDLAALTGATFAAISTA